MVFSGMFVSLDEIIRLQSNDWMVLCSVCIFGIREFVFFIHFVCTAMLSLFFLLHFSISFSVSVYFLKPSFIKWYPLNVHQLVSWINFNLLNVRKVLYPFYFYYFISHVIPFRVYSLYAIHTFYFMAPHTHTHKWKKEKYTIRKYLFIWKSTSRWNDFTRSIFCCPWCLYSLAEWLHSDMVKYWKSAYMMNGIVQRMISGYKKKFFFSSLLFLYCSCNCVCVCVPGWGVEWVDGWTVKPSNHEAFNECFFANDVKSGIENYFIPHKVWIPISILLLLLLSIFISIFHWIHCSELLLWFCSCHTMHI